MKEETGYFSSFDGTKLFYRAWDKNSKDCLIIVHGIGEHSARYQDLASALNDLPISTFAFDSRGHGRSEGDRVFVESFRQFIDDVYSFRSFIESKNHTSEKRSFFLMGQSLGGLIATSVVLENQLIWKGLILTSPFFAVATAHPLLMFAAILINICFPRKIWNNPIKPLYLSHESEEVKKYITDPLIQRKITGRLAFEMFQACSVASRHAKEISIPVLILASGDDRIVSLKATQRFYNKMVSPQKSMKIFDSCYHELLHEKERHEVIQMIKDFLVYQGRS